MRDDEISSNPHWLLPRPYTILKKRMSEGVHICNMGLGSESNNVPDQLEIVGLKSVAYLSTIVLDAHSFLYED